MERIYALSFTFEEFRIVCDRVLEEKAWIENDSSGWFWVVTEEINEDEVKRLLEIEFGKEISGFRIDNIYVDVTNSAVIVLYK